MESLTQLTIPYRRPNSVRSLWAVAERGAEGVRPPCTGSRLGERLSELEKMKMKS